jgi:biopolymer transport protein ExbD
MKFDEHEISEIKLDLTSMIDVVFQLLVFFVMTFRVVAMEGDFNIRMPLASKTAEDLTEVLPLQINVKLNAGENGNISSIEVDGNTMVGSTVEEMYQKLTDNIEGQLAGVANPDEARKTEVEFDIEFNLKYKFTVLGIEAVSGRKNPDGSVTKLIEKIKFKDNSQRGG